MIYLLTFRYFILYNTNGSMFLLILVYESPQFSGVTHEILSHLGSFEQVSCTEAQGILI